MAARGILPAILLALAIIGILRLRIDVDILNLLPSDSPVARGLAVYQDEFLQAGEMIAVIRSTDADTTLNAATSIVQRVRLETNLIERAFWQPPANESLTDAAKFVAYLWLNAPTGEVVQLRNQLQGESLREVVAASRERIATSFNPADLFLLPRDPLNLAAVSSKAGDTFDTPEKFFSSEDGLTRLVYLYSAVPLNNYEQCHSWVREVRGAINDTLQKAGVPNVEVLLTGRPVFMDEISSGMRNDMSMAVPGTLFLIGVLFYLLHREWIALFLLLGTLFGIMIWAALAGSAIIGQLNVISVGFASILLGLAEDFGIVLHQELKNHPELDADGVRRIAGPGIFWSAVTTATAFGLLNLSGLPGLRNLGTLVALGIIIGAWAMLYLFLPLLIRFRRRVVQESRANQKTALPQKRSTPWRGLAVTMTAVVLAVIGWATAPPLFDASPDVLRPRKSEASAALRIVQDTIGATGDPFWLLINGSSVQMVHERLEKLETHLETNRAEIGIRDFTLPKTIWPAVQAQSSNAPLLKEIAADAETIRSTVLENGFGPDALEFAKNVFAEWESFQSSQVNWPRGRIAEWVLPKFVAQTETNYIALGLLTPEPGFRSSEAVPAELRGEILLSGWSLLGNEVLDRVRHEMPLVTSLVGIAVLVALWFTFRNIGAVLLSVAVLVFSAIVLLGSMGTMGWKWNLISLTALPLLLGMGIDYSIHMQTTLERFAGDTAQTFHSVGRALLLAGSTTIIGFGFLGMSSNAGMASLGKVCALGLGILLLTSVFLLPAWVQLTRKRESRG